MSNESYTLFDQTTAIAIAAIVTALASSWAWMASNSSIDLPEYITVQLGTSFEIPLVVLAPIISALITLWLARSHIARRLGVAVGDAEDGGDSDGDSPESSGSEDQNPPARDRHTDGRSGRHDASGGRQRRSVSEPHPDAPTDSAIPALEDEEEGVNGTETSKKVSPPSDAGPLDATDRSGSREDRSGPSTESPSDGPAHPGQSCASDSEGEDDEDEDSANPVTERDISRYGDRNPTR